MRVKVHVEEQEFGVGRDFEPACPLEIVTSDHVQIISRDNLSLQICWGTWYNTVMELGVNIATWCFDRDPKTRERQYEQLARAYPDKYVRFLQSGYTFCHLFPWYSKDHEETVLKELKERGWLIYWCLLNDNPIKSSNVNLSSSKRREQVVRALSFEDIINSWDGENLNLLLIEMGAEVYRLKDYVSVFELVNADISNEFVLEVARLAIMRICANNEIGFVQQGSFLYDYRRKPKPDVRLSGSFGCGRPHFISEFGVEASVDKEALAERMIFLLGSIQAYRVLVAFHHEYVSRAWGWDTWPKDGATEVLWDPAGYKDFLKKRGADEGAAHSKYVGLLRPEILSVLKEFK